MDLDGPTEHLDDKTFALGNGVSKKSCFPVSNVQEPARQETRGEGETIRSS